jgi:hypothetical protein
MHHGMSQQNESSGFLSRQILWSSDCDTVYSSKRIQSFQRDMLPPSSGWNCIGQGKVSAYVGKYNEGGQGGGVNRASK